MHLKKCPHCSANMVGEPIPEKHRCKEDCAKDFNNRTKKCLKNHYYGKDSKYFYRSVYVEVRGVYDGGLYIMCPDCNGTWPCSFEDNPLRVKVQTYIRGDQRLSYVKNSCSGCQDGFELNQGIHYDGDHIHMVCIKARYSKCANGCPDWQNGNHKFSCRLAR